MRIFDNVAVFNVRLLLRRPRLLLKGWVGKQFLHFIMKSYSRLWCLTFPGSCWLEMVDLFFGAIDIDAHLFPLHALVTKDQGYLIFEVFFDFFRLGIGLETDGVVLVDGAFRH